MMPYPVWAYALLVQPRRVEDNLRALVDAGVIAHAPSLWQVATGVLRMLHRITFRPQTIGLSGDQPVRRGWRARILRKRAVRLPFLLAAGSVRPWDLSGLTSSADQLIRHLVATHHDRLQFVYDLQLLMAHPGKLEALRDAARAVVDGDDPHADWFRDLVVYEGYHDTLLAAAEAALSGRLDVPDDDARDPDVSLPAFLAWCADQPATVADTLRAWRRGEIDLNVRTDVSRRLAA